MTISRLIFVLSGLSGVCGLAYEVIYSRLFSNYFGDHFVINGIVLCAVFLGISFGAWKSSQFIKQLAYIELGIGLYAIAITTVFSAWGFEISGFNQSLVFNAVKLVVLLFIPTFFIGTCVPLFTRYVSSFGNKNVSAFTGVYILYNLGALLSVIAIEFFLLRQWGLRITTYIIGAINFLIGGLLLLQKNNIQKNLSEKKKRYKLDRPVIAVLFLASFASGIFQLYTIRMANMVFGPFRENLAIILISTMLGIAIGSMLSEIKKFSLEKSLIGTLLGCLCFLLLLSHFISIWSVVSGSVSEFWYLFLKIFFLVGYSLFIFTMFGSWVPLVVRHHKAQGTVDVVGPILGISSLANGLGTLFMFLVLYRYLDLLQNGILILILFIVSYMILILKKGTKKLSSDLLFKVIFVSLSIFFIIGFWPEKTLLLGYQTISSFEKLKNKKENIRDSLFYRAFDQDVSMISFKDGSRSLVLNGYRSLNFRPYDKRPELREMILGISPVLFTKETKDALMLGLGSGITGGVTAEFYQNTKIVEINPAMLKIPKHFASENRNVMEAENVEVILDDGVSILLRENKTYDAIFNNVPNPQYHSAGKLHTRDFYKIILSRLKEDGVYSSWFSLSMKADGISVMLNTFENTFHHCRYFLLSYSYFNVVCGKKPLDYLSFEKVIERTKGSHVMKWFYKSGFRDHLPRVMKALEIQFGNQFFPRTSKKENTLDLPIVEFINQSPGGRDLTYKRLKQAIEKNIRFQKEGNTDLDWKYSCRTIAEMSAYRFAPDSGTGIINYINPSFQNLGCFD